MRRVIFLVVGAVALVLAGFGAGWFLSARQPGEASSSEVAAPPATVSTMLREDEPGEDIPGMPRYPGSIRAEYERERIEDFVATDVEYVTTDDPATVQEFYREVFRAEGWVEADIGVVFGEVFFFVTKGEREVVVEIEERPDFTEIEIEETKPLADEAVESSPR
ncbi:MAG: hypothetical protein M3494_04630 [Actinomycetota bacterium]|jgi:hypothetical protein|nr:hypothetical protein [Rubrobacter sp.]MDQ3507290.1 hypothetical protein [Actinomycetota bacterium]